MIIAGRRVQGAGIFPFDAELLSDPLPPAPVTSHIVARHLAGHPRDRSARIQERTMAAHAQNGAASNAPSASGPLSAEGDWYFHHHAVGSLLHLHLGALPEVVDAFACPHPPSLRRPSTHG